MRKDTSDHPPAIRGPAQGFQNLGPPALHEEETVPFPPSGSCLRGQPAPLWKKMCLMNSFVLKAMKSQELRPKEK